MTKDRVYKIHKSKHPTLKNRSITLIYIDNKIDLASLSFLVYEARNGGRKESISGKMTHVGRAYKIIEMYRNLEKLIGKEWWEAEEEDIRQIRNGMLCWDIRDQENYEYYDYEPIENDTMNAKLSVWFKFFKHQRSIGGNMRMTLSTSIIKVYQADTFLQHIQGIGHGQKYILVEKWDLLVKPSPLKLYYPAISELEFKALRVQLKKEDVVYEAIALFMVKTGLRIDAVLEYDGEDFNGWMKHLNYGGKSINSNIPISYINKGGETKQAYLPLRCVEEIQYIYRASHYLGRLYRFQENLNSHEQPQWLRSDGKQIKYRDVQKVFLQASKNMGREKNNITPHHMRHTYATWRILDKAEENGIELGVIDGSVPEILMYDLAHAMGHASHATTFKYTMTAFHLKNIENANTRDTSPTLTMKAIEENEGVQKILLDLALNEFGNNFDDNKYDPYLYAQHYGFNVVNYMNSVNYKR